MATGVRVVHPISWFVGDRLAPDTKKKNISELANTFVTMSAVDVTTTPVCPAPVSAKNDPVGVYLLVVPGFCVHQMFPSVSKVPI